jgi:PPOX class probable FMN-dependent enzyme
MSFDAPVHDEGLRSLYREPSQVVIDKAIDHVDAGVRDFIERSPLFVLATGDGRNNDASPRGGPAGFVRVLDEHRIAFGDLVGNNRIDSYRNLAQHPGVGMLFMIPGLLETLRVNGTATLSVDDELRERCAIDGRVPRVVIGVEVTECFIHCGAALRRAGAWDVSTWPAAQDRPSAAAILKAHTALDVPTEAIEENLRSYYDHGIWEVGGGADG